jgi:hypothetical protein
MPDLVEILYSQHNNQYPSRFTGRVDVMRKNSKFSSAVAILAARNADETVLAHGVESCVLCVGGSLESGGWICVDVYGRNLASVTQK